MNLAFKNINEYIMSFPELTQVILRNIRAIINRELSSSIIKDK
jgi:hypothetical protein